ncbi:MAG: hypothetical protein AAF549_00255 [Pseudomonadota bacterium]
MALTDGQRKRTFEAAMTEPTSESLADGLCGLNFFGGGVHMPPEEDASQGESTPSAQKPKDSGGTFGDMIP